MTARELPQASIHVTPGQSLVDQAEVRRAMSFP